MRRYRIRIFPGDRIKIELSPYDLTRGRIVYRYRYRTRAHVLARAFLYSNRARADTAPGRWPDSFSAAATQQGGNWP